MLKFRKASLEDTDTILQLYEELINAVKDNKYNPQWDYGVYPKEETITNAIKEGNLYVGTLDSEIVSSIVVDHNTNLGYENIEWKIDENYENIYVIHLVAVKNSQQKKGIATQMLNEVFQMAKENNIKSLRLSIIENNLPAEKVYKKLEFEYIDTISVHADDRGLKTFDLYEKVLC